MRRLAAGLLWAALLQAGAPSIQLTERDGRAVFVAQGCPAEAFSVYVDGLADAPPMAGAYSVSDGSIMFRPRYAPSPGVSYRAECRQGSAVVAAEVFAIPQRDLTPTTTVEHVYPSAGELPENLLKFYVHFSAPMSRGEAYRHVSLLDQDGEPVELPFLEIDEELWDANYQRLTLLFDPGRIKTGLVPNQEVGVALHAGRSYTLAIDAGWLDAEGKPLKASHEKRFTVVPADTEPPDPENWVVSAPAGGSDPLLVDFPEPLDQALLSRVLAVTTLTGEAIAGRVSIRQGETRWAFEPDQPWRPGRYRIEAQTILEDLAGNSIHRPFEVDVFEKVEERIAGATASLLFSVGGE